MKIKTLTLTLAVSLVLLGACISPPPASPVSQETPTPSALPIPPETPALATSPIPQEIPSTPISTPVPTATPTPPPVPQVTPYPATPTPVQTTTSTPTPTPTGPYTGPLFDTHFHLLLSTLSSRFRSAKELFSYLDGGKVDWALGFYQLPPSRWYPEVTSAEQIISAAGKRVIPLIMPAMATWQQFASGQYGETVLRQFLQPKGHIWGVGEIWLPDPFLQSVTFDSSVMQTTFQVVNELKGILMIHTSTVSQGGRSTELAEIEPSIRKYPDTIFLFHCNNFDLIAQLMSRYPNVYFSMDAASTWIDIDSDYTAESFLAYVNRTGFDRLVQQGINRVSPRLQQYPDRIFWGTDIGVPWRDFEDSVTDIVIRTSREIIGRLPPDLQEKYAYKNALNVFGRFLTPKP